MAKKASEKDSFKWSDDKAELLLKVTRDYKALKVLEGVDWESVQSKYSNIQRWGNTLRNITRYVIYITIWQLE